MRLKSIAGAAMAVLGFGLALAGPAEASHRKPAGWGEVRTVRHYGYYPRYNHVYSVHYRTDPYAYRYSPRSYYPYYNSGYWRPASQVAPQARYRVPPYYQAWGYPVRTHSRREWYARHHGRRW